MEDVTIIGKFLITVTRLLRDRSGKTLIREDCKTRRSLASSLLRIMLGNILATFGVGNNFLWNNQPREIF